MSDKTLDISIDKNLESSSPADEIATDGTNKEELNATIKRWWDKTIVPLEHSLKGKTVTK